MEPGNTSDLPPVADSTEQQVPSEWQYNPGEAGPLSGSTSVGGVQGASAVSWSAPEFTNAAKSAGWYMGFAVGLIVVLVLTYFLTHDFITIVSLAFVALLFLVGTSRRPAVVEYELDDRGLSIGNKFYAYGSFKSFAVAQERDHNSLMLMPLKRFMPMMVAGYPIEMQDQIMDVVEQFLPYREHTPDAIDKLSTRLHL